MFGSTLNPSDRNHTDLLLIDQRPRCETVLTPPYPDSALSPGSTMMISGAEDVPVKQKEFTTTKSLASTKGTLTQSAQKKSFVPTKAAL